MSVNALLDSIAHVSVAEVPLQLTRQFHMVDGHFKELKHRVEDLGHFSGQAAAALFWLIALQVTQGAIEKHERHRLRRTTSLTPFGAALLEEATLGFTTSGANRLIPVTPPTDDELKRLDDELWHQLLLDDPRYDHALILGAVICAAIQLAPNKRSEGASTLAITALVAAEHLSALAAHEGDDAYRSVAMALTEHAAQCFPAHDFQRQREQARKRYYQDKR